MNNQTIFLKLKQRLNKLDSQDFDNFECWQVVEAFNKGMVEWCRRNLHGTNLKKEGDEESKRRIDDLQVLLTPLPIVLQKRPTFEELVGIPDDYLEWKRVDVLGKSECCEARPFVVYLAEEANVPSLLRDVNKKPSFEYAETFCTLQNNNLRIYTNGEFAIEKPVLYYYRQPRRIQILGCMDPYTFQVSTAEVLCEFKDDLIELFIVEAAKILAGDIESGNQAGISGQSVEENN